MNKKSAVGNEILPINNYTSLNIDPISDMPQNLGPHIFINNVPHRGPNFIPHLSPNYPHQMPSNIPPHIPYNYPPHMPQNIPPHMPYNYAPNLSQFHLIWHLIFNQIFLIIINLPIC